MWMAIGIMGALGFIIAIVGTLVMAIKRNPVWKKWLAAVGICFVLFIVGVVNTPSSDSTQKEQEVASISSQDSLKKSTESFNKGMDLFSNQKYEAALGSFKGVIKEDPNYSVAQSKSNEAKPLLAQQLLTKAKDQLAKNEFDNAINNINKALSYNPSMTEASDLKNTIIEKQNAYIEQQKQQGIADYKNSCQVLAYKVLNKNPDSLEGTKVKLHGKIMQIQESGNSTFILLETTNMGYNVWSDNVAVYYDGKVNVYEDDVIDVWGEVTGSFSYKSTAGWDITIPGVRAKYF